MLEESDFKSWKIHIERYIRGKHLGKLIWKSIKNGRTPHLMIKVTTGEGEQQTQVTREKTDEEFIEAKNNKERADIQSYEQHAMKTLRKMNQTSGNADSLAYMAQATQLSSYTLSQYVPPPPQYAPAPQQAPQLTNDAMLATMNQIINMLSGFQKQFPPTNNQLRTFTNPMTQATIQAGQITIESKEKGMVLDAEAKAFLPDVEFTVSYAEPLAITTTIAFEVSHEDAYDSNVDEGPYAAATFMAILKQTGPSTGEGSNNDTDFHVELKTYDNHFFDNLNHQVS
uniref:Uncharacterized protein n=1 Tax=Tanacetum cinerariifolium TaxID=118510 RepID=A0A699KH55_TANCI|nr:hypothetical protein [Tanacetum cinerariifolium]